MSTPLILILTEPKDITADLVAEKLVARGAEMLRVDNAQFPAEGQLSIGFESRQMTRCLRLKGQCIDLHRIAAAWDRRPEAPVPHTEISRAQARTFVQQESRYFLDDVWHSLDCLWLPAPKATILRAQHKLTQLQLAQSLGFDLPDTLVSHDPTAVLDFYRRHNGDIVGKVFHNNLILPDEQAQEFFAFRSFTQRVQHRSLGYIQSVRYCPMIFQAYAPKKLELRITVVGHKVFSAEIHSQLNRRTQHDWRHYNGDHTPYREHALPDALKDKCLALTQALGLSYGAIDLVLTPDDQYLFLEINPTGQWRWIEAMTGLPISAAIAELLLTRQQAHVTSQARAGARGTVSYELQQLTA